MRFFLILLLLVLPLWAERCTAGEDEDLAEINRRLENPLTKLWSLTFQENLAIQEGDVVDGTTYANTLFFQPALPLPVGDDLVFFARPVFPLVTSPVLDPTSSDGVDRHETGFGDIQMLSLLGPSKSQGLVWGGGATFKFPTASKDVLGQEKWQIGPAAMLFHLGNPWTIGFLAQQWWSVAGDHDRANVSQTEFQYVARRQIPGAMSIGMGPNVTIDWEADSDNQVTFPIGLGITKTVRMGRFPVKMRFEPQYSIIRPDDLGTEWNFRLQFAPVIPSPFK